MEPDVELMLHFAQGDLTAFEELLRKHKNMVINLAYRIVQNYSDAEDIAQEVFLKIYNSAKTYKPEAKFSTWVYKITVNLSLNRLRGKKHLPTLPLEETLPISDPNSPETNLEKQELINKVRTALNSLPENQKLAVILQRYENLSYEEIAKIIGTSVSAVDSLIQRAKQNLRRKLELYVSPSSLFFSLKGRR